MATLDDLKMEMKGIQGTLVLDHFDVVRLIDVVDGEDDYYWVYKSSERGVYWSSCCGRWIPLKGKLDEKDYNEIERVWGLNENNWDYFQSIKKEQHAVIRPWVNETFPEFGTSTSDFFDWDGKTLRVWTSEDAQMKMFTLNDLKDRIKDFPEVKF
jgi:hypothetical protein